MSATDLPVFVAASEGGLPKEASTLETFAVAVPAGTTEIGNRAFRFCKGLAQITLPPGLARIGKQAFFACGGLKQVTLPPGLTRIEKQAFFLCEGLAQVTFPPELTHIGENAFRNCGGLAQVTLPLGLIHIGESAFAGCKGLAQVTLPHGLTRIEKQAFFLCEGLAQVTFPPGLTHIGGEAFVGCKGLAQITFPPGLTYIGRAAFFLCIGLTEVTLPPGLNHIGSKAFDCCPSITTVLITPNLAHRPGPYLDRRTSPLADAVRKIKQGGATVRWAPPLTFTLTTLGGDVVEVALPTIPSRFPADFDIAAELASAAAAELGVHRDEIYIVEGKTILYRPTITVTVVVLDTDVVDGHEIAVVRRDVAAVPMVLATECGPTDEAGTVAPTTVRYARRKIATTVFGIPEAEAGAAIQLHVGANGTGADDGQGHGFRKLGDYRDLEAGLAAAGVVDGAVVGVRARKRGWRRQRAELIPVMAPSEDGAQGGTRGWGGRQLSIV